MSQSFAGRIALITGGSSGIGAAAARLLAEGGAQVSITGRHEATLKQAASAHANIDYVVADIANPADNARTVDELKRRHGRLDILVNNAGIAEIAGVGDASSAHVHRIFEVNVYGLIELTRLALPLLRQSKGNLVNVASTVADRPFAQLSVYSASKAAVLALTRAWAKELAGEGVRVNAVSPGPIETPIHTPEKLKISETELGRFAENVLALVPSKRFGSALEAAHVIAFLASSEASFVNGAEYTVGGGIEA